MKKKKKKKNRLSVLVFAAPICGVAIPCAHADHNDEVRAMISEMMADAEQRTSLLQSGSSTLSIQGDDGASLRIWGFTQFRYNANYREGPLPDPDNNFESGFSIARTRLFADARINETFSSRIRANFSRSTGNLSLDQAYVNVALPEGFKLRVGQFQPPLFRDEWINAEKQLAVNSSIVNVVFGQGQVQGVWLNKEWTNLRFWTAFSDGLRSGNSDYTDPIESDAAFTGRLEWKIVGDDWSRFDDYTSFPDSDLAIMAALGGHWETGSRIINSGELDSLYYVTADLGIEGDGWNVFGAVVAAVTDSSDLGWVTDGGFIVQGGAFVAPSVELFARYDTILPGNRPGQDDPFQSITAGFNWYIMPRSHALKLTANVIYFPDEQSENFVPQDTNAGLLQDDEGGQFAFQIQMQVIF